MRRSPAPEPPSSEITPESLYLRRREFIKNAALTVGTAVAFGGGLVLLVGQRPPPDAPDLPDLPALAPPVAVPANSGAAGPDSASADTAANSSGAVPPGSAAAVAASPVAGAATSPGAYDTDETMTPYASITTYNNYYEFGLDKDEPARNAHTLQTRPWTISVEGEVAKPQVIDIDALLQWFPLEQRIYRMRCVEAWSMVIPWQGFPLADLINRLEPTANAKFVEFTTLLNPEQMPGQRDDVLQWPYVDGLRMDEAMHPLTLIAVGLYGKVLPNQDGAPLRLVVPWKYGFKGVKSIVKIRFTATQPKTSWSIAAPNEYGFYANVNPAVDHPRWSQATERRIGDLTRRKTLPFNGYADQVASLYAGMDLRANF